MKRKFKKGDRVLVRDSDLHEWIDGTFIELAFDNERVVTPFFVRISDDATGYYSQCRHIDDFRTGNKVQVRSSMTEEWEDAVYACYVPHDSFEHWVYSEDEDDLTCHKLCRWHPSLPWAEKEEIIDEPYLVKTIFQRLDDIERKLHEK